MFNTAAILLRLVPILACLIHNCEVGDAATTIPNSDVGLTVLTNSSTVLDCVTDTAILANIVWYFMPVGSTSSSPVTDGTGCTLKSEFSSTYGLAADSSTSSCALIILNASNTLAGNYQCGDYTANSDTINVTTLEKNPIVSISINDAGVDVSCSVEFYGTAPAVVWYNDTSGQEIGPVINSTVGNRVISTYTYEQQSECLTNHSITAIPIITCYVFPPPSSGIPYSWTSPIFAGSTATASEITMDKYWMKIIICFLLINEMMSCRWEI